MELGGSGCDSYSPRGHDFLEEQLEQQLQDGKQPRQVRSDFPNGPAVLRAAAESQEYSQRHV